MTIIPMNEIPRADLAQVYELGFDTGYAAGLEMAATKLQAWTRRLHVGEMTTQEARTIVAVLNSAVGIIRAMKKDVP